MLPLGRRIKVHIGFGFKADQHIEGNVEKLRQLLSCFQVGHGIAGFPFGNGLAGDADLFGDRFLGQAAGFPEMDQVFTEHGVPPSYARSAFIRERKAREESTIRSIAHPVTISSGIQHAEAEKSSRTAARALRVQ